MKVLKFGGSALASASKMKSVVNLLNNNDEKIVVFSAVAGTTDALTEVSDYLYKKNPAGANEVINGLEQRYAALIAELFSSDALREAASLVLAAHFESIRALTKDLFTLFEEKAVTAQGELIASSLMYLLLKEKNLNVALIPALEFMRTDKNSEPDLIYLKEKLDKQLKASPDADVYVTQGYICRNAYGETDCFDRSHSDISASLIGAAIHAEEICIWTSIDGGSHENFILNVPHLQFEEAAELAYFGAKILHPSCLQPAKLNNIPVRLLNTLDANAQGTLISNTPNKGKIKAIAAKDGITAIQIRSERMLLAHGFLRKVFGVFENYQTAIDMVVTSEVGVSVTVDNEKFLPDILDELKKYGTVSADKNSAIVCAIGDLDWERCGAEATIIQALKDIPIRMISYGGSKYNISFLISSDDKQKAMKALNESLFHQSENDK